MKTTESKYTLVVADLQWGDTETQQGIPGRLQDKLNQIGATAVEVGRGMFLFDTQRDYHSIQLLLQLFQASNRMALALPIESELHLVCGETIAELIGSAFPDLKLYQVKATPRQ